MSLLFAVLDFQVDSEFIDMLKEDKAITTRTHWKKVKDDFSDDDRYLAISSSERREELFKKYRQQLIDVSICDHASLL